MAFMIGLAKIDPQTHRLRLILKPPGYVIKRVCPIDFRLAHPEQIQVGAVQDINYGLVGQFLPLFLFVRFLLAIATSRRYRCFFGFRP